MWRIDNRKGLAMKKRFGVTLTLMLLLTCSHALSAPRDDIATLSAFQRVMSDLTNDFVALSTRFQESRDVKSSDISNTLGDAALVTQLQLELLKDSVVGMGLLKCDRASQDYFKQVTRERLGNGGVIAFLDLKIREISTSMSFASDPRLIAQAERFRQILRNIREAIVSMRSRYT